MSSLQEKHQTVQNPTQTIVPIHVSHQRLVTPHCPVSFLHTSHSLVRTQSPNLTHPKIPNPPPRINPKSQRKNRNPDSNSSYSRREKMADWGPVVIAVVLFVLLTPGLLFQIPGRGRIIEFGNMQTSGASILVHTIIYFGLITILLIAVGVHIYTG